MQINLNTLLNTENIISIDYLIFKMQVLLLYFEKHPGYKHFPAFTGTYNKVTRAVATK